MKKLLTQFGKELRDSTQSIISKEVLEFLHITSLTDEESYLPLKVIDTIFEELRDGFYFDSHSKHSIGVLSNYFENATFANLIPMFDKELIDGDEDLDLILSFDKYYQKKLGIPLKLLIMFKEIESHSDKTMTVALSHATPFEDSLGDWNDVYNRNEEINKLISEILLLTYQKTKGD